MKTSLLAVSLCAAFGMGSLFADFNFLAISDIHLAADGSGGKYAQRDMMIKLLNSTAVNTPVVLLPGDITNYGTAEEQFFYENNWLPPLNAALKRFNGKVWACLGNHDMATNKWYKKCSMVKYIERTYGNANFYSFDVENLHFICCGICPKDDIITACCKPDVLGMLASDLAENGHKKIVLFWHYNEKGPFSGFWPEGTKAEVDKILAPYRANILGIFNGHCHSPQFTMYWGINQIPVSLVAGSYFAVCEYRNMKDLTVTFMNAAGDTKTWEEMYRDMSTKSKRSTAFTKEELEGAEGG